LGRNWFYRWTEATPSLRDARETPSGEASSPDRRLAPRPTAGALPPTPPPPNRSASQAKAVRAFQHMAGRDGQRGARRKKGSAMLVPRSSNNLAQFMKSTKN